jgi:hypothetical protein
MERIHYHKFKDTDVTSPIVEAVGYITFSPFLATTIQEVPNEYEVIPLTGLTRQSFLFRVPKC